MLKNDRKLNLKKLKDSMRSMSKQKLNKEMKTIKENKNPKFKGE